MLEFSHWFVFSFLFFLKCTSAKQFEVYLKRDRRKEVERWLGGWGSHVPLCDIHFKQKLCVVVLWSAFSPLSFCVKAEHECLSLVINVFFFFFLIDQSFGMETIVWLGFGELDLFCKIESWWVSFHTVLNMSLVFTTLFYWRRRAAIVEYKVQRVCGDHDTKMCLHERGFLSSVLLALPATGEVVVQKPGDKASLSCSIASSSADQAWFHEKERIFYMYAKGGFPRKGSRKNTQ